MKKGKPQWEYKNSLIGQKKDWEYRISATELIGCPVCGIKYTKEGKYLYRINCEHKKEGRHSLKNYKLDAEIL